MVYQICESPDDQSGSSYIPMLLEVQLDESNVDKWPDRGQPPVRTAYATDHVILHFGSCYTAKMLVRSFGWEA